MVRDITIIITCMDIEKKNTFKKREINFHTCASDGQAGRGRFGYFYTSLLSIIIFTMGVCMNERKIFKC